jgi:predicted tellurium resistance membrane protein TerC
MVFTPTQRYQKGQQRKHATRGSMVAVVVVMVSLAVHVTLVKLLLWLPVLFSLFFVYLLLLSFVPL